MPVPKGAPIPKGAPKGNKNRLKHGAYSKRQQLQPAAAPAPAVDPPAAAAPVGDVPQDIPAGASKGGSSLAPTPQPTATLDSQIAFMEDVQRRINAWIERQTDEAEIIKAFGLLSQNVSRLARLIQARQLIQKPNADWLDRALEVISEDIELALAERGHHAYA